MFNKNLIKVKCFIRTRYPNSFEDSFPIKTIIVDMKNNKVYKNPILVLFLSLFVRLTYYIQIPTYVFENLNSIPEIELINLIKDSIHSDELTKISYKRKYIICFDNKEEIIQVLKYEKNIRIAFCSLIILLFISITMIIRITYYIFYEK